MIDYYLGDPARARASFEQSLALARQSGDQREIADSAYGLALTYHVDGAYERAQRLYEGCLATDRAHGYRASEGAVLNNLGHLALLRGDRGQARMLIRESLLASREAGAQRRLAFTLSAVAGLVAAEHEAERALRFDSAGQAALELLGASLAPSMRALYDQDLRAARDALGQDRAEAAEEAGRSISLEQAVDEALAWLGEASDTHEPDRATVPASPASAPSPDDPTIGLASSVIGETGREQPRIQRRAESTSPGATGDLQQLTPREREVAGLIARGCSNREIAEALVVSEGTAANYVQRVLNRLGFHNRTQVATWAVEHGFSTDRTPPHA